jgi:hypothetical protein
MALTAEAFDQIVNSLKSDCGRRFNEKRHKPRVGVRGRVQIVQIRPDGSIEPPLEVWVRDVSINGIGILHNKPLAKGSQFEAHFFRQDDVPLILTYVVAHHKSVVKGLYTIGAHLVGVDDSKCSERGLMN